MSTSQSASSRVEWISELVITPATAGGAYAWVVGYPNLGIRALADLGADLSKILTLDEPAEQWARAVAAVAREFVFVLLHAPGKPTRAQLDRLANRVRPTDRHPGCVLVVTNPWEKQHLTVSTGPDPRRRSAPSHTQWPNIGVGQSLCALP